MSSALGSRSLSFHIKKKYSPRSHPLIMHRKYCLFFSVSSVVILKNCYNEFKKYARAEYFQACSGDVKGLPLTRSH